MTLGFPADRWVYVVKAGINGEKDTAQDAQNEQQYDEQRIVGNGRTSDAKTRKHVQKFALRLELLEMCNSWRKIRVQVKRMSEMLDGLVAPAACQVYLSNSEVL